MRAVLNKRATRKSLLATFTKAQIRRFPSLAEMAYVSVNELSMPGRSDDCIPAFIEPLRSSKHRVSVSRPLLPPRPAQPRRAPCGRKALRWRKGRGKPSSCVGSSSLRFPLPPLRPEAPCGL